LDLILQTNQANPSLSLEGIERYSDGSGYGCNLCLRSGWVEAKYRFIFETPPLIDFIASLELLDKNLTGIAKLKPMWEAPFIEFEGTGLGQIEVRGILIEYSERSQQVQFAFVTDQTCLRPFIVGLKKAQCL